MTLALHLKTVGILLLALAFAHVFFPKRFAWKKEFSNVSLLNRQIFYVHCFFISLVLVLTGMLSLVYTSLLLRRDELAKVVLGGLLVFWVARLFIQLFVYDRSLWKGHPFNTSMHILFTGMWTYYVAVYGVAFFAQL